MHRVNVTTLKEEHIRQKKDKAVGVDGVNKEQYEQNLQGNLEGLVERMKRFEYRPQAVKRVYIPKANGKLRPLGLPAYEDKLVQGVMANILNEVYEPRFINTSYGFRPGRSQHQAVKQVNDAIMRKTSYVLEADIKGFFDNVDHGWMMKFLAHDIADKNFLRYIERFLKAGIMEKRELTPSEKGTPQGGLISPILSNVYLHYVLDLWVEKVLKKKCKGEVNYIRFADDFVMTFQHKSEAEKAMTMLKDRLAQFKLEVAEDKTRILPMGRFKGTKEKFDFLGFTFYNAKTLKGKYRVGVMSSEKKLKSKRTELTKWLKEVMHDPVAQTMKALNIKLQGHDGYYGVNGNSKKLKKFWWHTKYICLKILNRRHQKRSLKLKKFERIWKHYITLPKIKVQIWGKLSTVV